MDRDGIPARVMVTGGHPRWEGRGVSSPIQDAIVLERTTGIQLPANVITCSLLQKGGSRAISLEWSFDGPVPGHRRDKMTGNRKPYKAGYSHLRVGPILAAGALAAIPLFVLAGIYTTFPGDAVSASLFQSARNSLLDAVFRGLTWLGDPWMAVVLVAGTVIALLVWRRWADGATLTFILAPVLFNYLLKQLLARPRPDLLLMVPEPVTFSFPSGHSVFAVYYFGFLIYLSGILTGHPALRLGIRFMLVSLILGVGGSRVYLGAHWPSDVLGGYLLGGLALLAGIWVRRRVAPSAAAEKTGICPDTGSRPV